MIMEILLMMNKKQIKMEGNLFFIYSHNVSVLNEKKCKNTHIILCVFLRGFVIIKSPIKNRIVLVL